MQATDPHSAHRWSPLDLLRSCWRYRQLLAQLTRREIAQRHRGSLFGGYWGLLSPAIMLAIYTFVFSVVLKVRWNPLIESTSNFAIVLFAGLCVYNLFADIVTRSPLLIVQNTAFVKRVVFPLELLVLVNAGAALFYFALQILVLLLAQFWISGRIYPSALAFPLVIFPVLLLSVSMSWLIASVGVYWKDVTPTVGFVTVGLMFLSPIFYSMDAVPADFRYWLELNPLSFIINQARDVLIWGQAADWRQLALQSGVQASFAWLGYGWFQLTRKGFADVL